MECPTEGETTLQRSAETLEAVRISPEVNRTILGAFVIEFDRIDVLCSA